MPRPPQTRSGRGTASRLEGRFKQSINPYRGGEHGCVFLVSGESGYIAGSNLFADGAFTAWMRGFTIKVPLNLR